MSAFFKKLKSKAGESLVESLCAILIFTMASIVLFSMVSAANDINGKAKEQDAKNQAHLVAVEKGESTAKNGTGTVTFTLTTGSGDSVQTETIASVPVDVYGGQSDSLFAYFVQTSTTPSGG